MIFVKLFRLILDEFRGWIEFIVCAYPGTFVGNQIRRLYWRRKCKAGAGFVILRKTRVLFPEIISIGQGVIIGEEVIIDAGGSNGIYIGNNVAISQGSFIRAANHKIDSIDIPIAEQGHKCASIEYKGKNWSIVIEDGAWIAPHSIILSGANIGAGSIISAGSVVSGAIPPYSIVVGNPGRVTFNRLKRFAKEETPV